MSSEEERHDRKENTLYPAAAQPSMAFSDHYPVSLAMPWGRAKETKGGRRLVRDGLEPEVWDVYETELRRRFISEGLLLEDTGAKVELVNLNRYYHRAEKLLEEVFAPC